VRVVNFRNRFPEFSETVSTSGALRPKRLPQLTFRASCCPTPVKASRSPSFRESFTEPLPLGKFAGDLPAGRWVQVRIPSRRVSYRGPFMGSGNNTCRTSFFFRDERMVCVTRSSRRIRVDDMQPETRRLRTRFPRPKRYTQSATIGTLKSAGIRWIACARPLRDLRSLEGKDFLP